MSTDATTVQSSGGPDTAGRRFLLVLYRADGSQVIELDEGGELVVGRGPEASLCVEDRRLSRRHARFWRDGDRVFVEDLGSTNGTRVNGVRIGERQRIGPGDEIGLGALTVAVSALVLRAGAHRVLTDGELDERLESEADRARRYRRPLSLLALRLLGGPDAIRQQLLSVGAVLRRMDTLASYGPRDYAVLLPEADRSAAGSVAERVLAAAEAGARTGLATLPDDAASGAGLLEVARTRLRGAPSPGSGAAQAPGVVPRTVIAESAAMAAALRLAARVAAVESTVLILGETGSGKQVVAEEIHRASRRAAGPILQVNCSAIPPSLFESALFGHERGAFTGADARRIGYVEAARGGTLLLDEIGELPAEVQPKLLHLLERQRFTRVGGTRTLQGDLRILAATNRDLEAEVRAGHFREDLYFRLSAFVIHVPPLRERREDIAPLCRHLCLEFAAAHGRPAPKLSRKALDRLEGYEWPGNVRQLRNAIERAVVLAEGGPITEAHLPERVALRARGDGPLEARMAQVEASAILEALRASHGNQSQAARALGITRRALIYRMKKLGVR
ncbi:MAG: sigma 54-interacting transcriptional regulator [Acidobacteriota bacterium]